MNYAMLPVALIAVGMTIHGGGLLLWSILFNFRSAWKNVPLEFLVRLYRGWGPVSGISLGVWIFSSLYRYPSVANPGRVFPDTYRLNWGGLVDNLTTIRAIAFGVLWVSYTILEVWTLEPCRSLDKDGQVTDRVAYERTVKKVSRQLAFNALLFLVILVLGAVGARP